MNKKQNILDFKLHDRIELSPLKNPPLSTTPPKPIYTSIIQSSPIPSNKGTNTNLTTQSIQVQNSQNVFLKKKLVETHSKLLQQLQEAKKYQKQISDLTDDIEKYKVKINSLQSKIEMLNNQILQQENLKVSSKDTNTQIEELKKRLNEELISKNRLIQDNSKTSYEFKNMKNHLIQLEIEIETKMKQNNQLETKLLLVKKNHQSISHQHELEIEKLRNKINDSKKLMVQEVKETQSDKKMLAKKIDILQQEIENRIEQNYQLRKEMQNRERNRQESSEKNKFIDELKYEINKGRAIIYERDQEVEELRLKLKMKPYKKTYDDTRNLIERLEHVEHLTRSRGLMKGNSQSTLGRSIKTKTESESDIKRNKSRGKIINKVFSDE